MMSRPRIFINKQDSHFIFRYLMIIITWMRFCEVSFFCVRYLRLGKFGIFLRLGMFFRLGMFLRLGILVRLGKFVKLGMFVRLGIFLRLGMFGRLGILWLGLFLC